MRIGVLGINSKLADLHLRERLAKACQKYFALQNCLHGPHRIVLLSTCNRTELYFYSHDLAEAHIYILSILRQEIQDEFDQKLYSYFGVDCFLHLCRVTSGLDSAIIGETEIQGQVKNAYEQATEYFALPKEVHFLFQKALMIGKKARGLMPVQPDLLGLEHAVFNAAKEHFKALEDVKILLIGASEINCKVIHFLKMRKLQNITLCNRSPQAAKVLVENLHLHWLNWTKIDQWHHFDWIIFGTKSSEYLFTQETLKIPFQNSKLLIDLSVPRNVDPSVAADPRITLHNIDQLNGTLLERRVQMDQFLGRAEELILNSTRLHSLLFSQKNREPLQASALSSINCYTGF